MCKYCDSNYLVLTNERGKKLYASKYFKTFSIVKFENEYYLCDNYCDLKRAAKIVYCPMCGRNLCNE